jgi:uncharacterized membrane protein YccC
MPRLLSSHRSQLWLALRMTVAASLAYALAAALSLPQGFWAVLTTIIVTQNSVGSSLKAAGERLVGSICGALVGAATAILLPSHTPLVLGLALASAVAPLALLTAFYPALRIAPVTAIIVLLSSGAPTAGPIGYALDRILEIMLGTLVGLGVSLLIAPARAVSQVRAAASQTTALLAEAMAALVPAVSSGAPDLATLPTQLDAAVNRLQTAVSEAAHERRSWLLGQPDPEPLLRTLRRLRDDIFALHRVVQTPWPQQVQAMLAAPWSSLASTIATTLQRTVADLLPDQPEAAAAEQPRTLGLAVDAFNAAIAAVRRDGLTRDLPADAVGRILGSVYLVQQLCRDLDDLLQRMREARASGA